jgi:purine-binding chemotaxis protein CheW
MGSGASNSERENRILRERAGKLASIPTAGPAEAEIVNALRFLLGAGTYAFENRNVREVLPLPLVTPLPCVPAFVRGIINVRGRIVSILDLEKILGLPDRVTSAAASVIILRSPDLEFGLPADEILGLAAIPLSILQPSLPTLTEAGARYVKGVTAEGLVLLDAAKMMADRNLLVDEVVVSA